MCCYCVMKLGVLFAFLPCWIFGVGWVGWTGLFGVVSDVDRVPTG